MLLLFYKSFPVIAQYLIYTSLNLTVPCRSVVTRNQLFAFYQDYWVIIHVQGLL
ncbi:hypothetical protein [Rickettsia sp. MEAM1 (Bemisia tabaci)]|uniref:hypothetical protein n=1 Tax=Rickettsia sp. MEAM1 (Bemisia tabaci) TaxID=1182263 RepID=UPI001E2B840F|nr:hypothetical protein [Rickettsia sp. MEAM1 (Bemisia tabaci)]